MKTTKILAVLLAFVLVISLAACTEPAEGNNGTTDTTTPVEDNTTGTTPETGDDTTDTTPVTGDDTADTTPVTGDNTTDTDADTEEIVPPAHPEQNIIDLADGVFEDPTFDDSTAVMFEQGSERVVENGQLKITCVPLEEGGQNQCYVQCWTKQDALTPGVYKVYYKASAVDGAIYWAQFCFGPGNACAGAATIDGNAHELTITHSNTGGNSVSFGGGGTATSIVFDYIQVVPVYD